MKEFNGRTISVNSKWKLPAISYCSSSAAIISVKLMAAKVVIK